MLKHGSAPIVFSFCCCFVASRLQAIPPFLTAKHSVFRDQQERMACQGEMEYRGVMGRMERQEETVSNQRLLPLFLSKNNKNIVKTL